MPTDAGTACDGRMHLAPPDPGTATADDGRHRAYAAAGPVPQAPLPSGATGCPVTGLTELPVRLR
jgi:hypothetical protein